MNETSMPQIQRDGNAIEAIVKAYEAKAQLREFLSKFEAHVEDAHLKGAISTAYRRGAIDIIHEARTAAFSKSSGSFPSL
jgi:hypothetical protein